MRAKVVDVDATLLVVIEVVEKDIREVLLAADRGQLLILRVGVVVRLVTHLEGESNLHRRVRLAWAEHVQPLRLL